MKTRIRTYITAENVVLGFAAIASMTLGLMIILDFAEVGARLSVIRF